MANKVRLYLFWLFLIIFSAKNTTFAAAVSRAPESAFDSAQLEKTAVVDGYGFKYGNLQQLEVLARALTGLAYTIQVPSFGGISSQSIQKFLTSRGFNLERKLTELFAGLSDEQKKAALEKKSFPGGLITGLNKLEQEIKDLFNVYVKEIQAGIEKDPASYSFNKAFETRDDIDALVAQIAKPGERLMVRSSGGEDRDNLANAGGNKSVANVAPRAIPILEAIGEVIASYLSEKSWIQRLGAQDETLFQVKQLTPILLQRMIGETAADKLPKCGVMFTEDAEGGIARYGEKDAAGKIKTTGITIIQSAYGHNEGVVNSLIPVDTFYVDLNRGIYPVIRPKIYRLRPKSGGNGLETVRNEDPEAVRKPSLNKAAIDSLKVFSNALENFYKKPMDVEFVIDEATKSIYIVQARPIVYVRAQGPSYLLDLEKIPAEDKLIGQAIGIAGGGMCIITAPEQLIAKSTIVDALAEYQDQSITEDARVVRAVIVGKMAPMVSHEATAFRSENKPVVYQTLWQRCDQWAETFNLIIDPQQGLVVKSSEEIKSAQSLIDAKRAALGWIAYPAPQALSLSEEFAHPGFLTDHKLQELLGSRDVYNALKKSLVRLSSWRLLINQIKHAAEPEALQALTQLLLEVRIVTQRYARDFALDQDLKKRIATLHGYLLYCAQQIRPTLVLAQGSPEYIKRLFSINFLEALLFQQWLPTDVIDCYSATTLIFKELKSEQKISQTLPQEKMEKSSAARLSRAVQYSKLTNFALSPEVAEQWKKFVAQIPKLKDRLLEERFGQLVARELVALDMLPMWLNTSFARGAKTLKEPAALARVLVDEYASESAFLKQLHEKKRQIDALNMSLFSRPASFEKAWKYLTTQILEYFMHDSFLKNFITTNDLGRLATIAVLTSFIDRFDQSIKALTGSTEYVIENKIGNMKIMLGGYIGLLSSLIKISKFPPDIIHGKEEDQATYRPPQKFAELMQSYLAKPVENEKLALQVTPDVDVSSINILNPSHYISILRHLDDSPTYEDIFIMTHQSLLALMGGMGKSYGATDVIMPPLVMAVEDMIKDINTGYDPDAELIGIDIQKQGAKISYSVPLGVHSLLFDIMYKFKDTSVSLAVRFSGENDENRWYYMTELIELIAAACNARVSDISVSDNGVGFTLHLTATAPLDELEDYLGKLSVFTRDHKFEIEPLIDKLRKSGVFLDFVDQQIKKYGLPDLRADRFFYEIIFFTLKDNPEKFREEAAKLINFALKNTEYDIMQGGLSLIKQVYGPERAFALATQHAAALLAKRDSLSQGAAFYIYEWLVQNGQAYEIAAKVARDYSRSADPYLQQAVLVLYKDLVNKGQEYKEAAQIGAWFLTSDNAELQNAAANVYKALLEKRQAFEEAIKIAGNLIKSRLVGLRDTGQRIYNWLFRENQGFGQGAISAQQLMRSGNLEDRLAGIVIFDKLFAKGRGYGEAIEIAAELVASSNPSLERSAITLFEMLFDEDRGYEEADKAAAGLTVKPDPGSRFAGLKLYESLFKMGEGFESAATVAGDLLVSKDAAMRDTGFKLYGKLFEKGQGFDQARDILDSLEPSSPERKALEELFLKSR